LQSFISNKAESRPKWEGPALYITGKSAIGHQIARLQRRSPTLRRHSPRPQEDLLTIEETVAPTGQNRLKGDYRSWRLTPTLSETSRRNLFTMEETIAPDKTDSAQLPQLTTHSDTRLTLTVDSLRHSAHGSQADPAISPRLSGDNTEINMPLLGTTTTTRPPLIKQWFQPSSSPKLIEVLLTASRIVLHLVEMFSNGFKLIGLTSAVYQIGSGVMSLIREISEYQRLTKAGHDNMLWDPGSRGIWCKTTFNYQ